ncbi:MAG: ATP-binding protein [Rhizobiaceae bacterium]
MKQASANGVRGSWMDSVKENLLKLTDAKPQGSPLFALQRRAKPFSVPTWAHFIKSELFLRRTIPVLIVILLLFVAATRTSTLITTEQEIEQATKTEISLLSQVIVSKLAANPSFETAIASPTLSEVFLADALSNFTRHDGRTVFLLNSSGKVVAQKPNSTNLRGAQLHRLTGGANLYTAPGTQNTVRSILLDGSIPALAIYQPITINDGSTIANLLISQTDKATYAGWYNSVNINITLFLAISSVLLVILYAYYAQGARAREIDQLYMETNARFDTALARGHSGLWDWDLSRGRIVWSQSMYQMLGMEPSGTVMGYGDLTKLMHPSDPDMMSLANQVFNSDQRQIDHRFRMMHSTGAWVWMRLRAELVRYKGCDPHLIGIAVDISEQEAIKQQSRNADIRLRDAIENISEAFVLWDAKKRLVMCNTKYQQLYNLPASAVTAGSLHEDVMAKSRKPRAKNRVPTDNNLEYGTQKFEAQIEDGSWLQISERRTRDGGFVSVGTDITQIKRNHEKLVKSEKSHMETISSLQKAKLELEKNTQTLVDFAEDLREEKERADAANQAKSEFLANVSHELRTPLNAIIGFSDIMRAHMFGPLGSNKYEEYADDIHHSGNFLLGVINDVLDMSKIEAGRFHINPETVHMHELLDETLRIIKVQADKAGITVSQKIPKTLELEADRRAVKQILLNLLSNAVKFTPKGGKIKVTAKALKHAVNIVIEDNGIGISEEALERLGQPFEQVQDQFTKNHKGSGLGLAIARSLAMLHGGTLKISSKTGKGTTVAVKLPLRCQGELDNQEQNEAAA